MTTAWDDVVEAIDDQHAADRGAEVMYVPDLVTSHAVAIAPPRGRVVGIHPTAVIGERPEMRDWIADATLPWHQPVIHPTARINAYVTVDGGCESPTLIGDHALLMAHVHVGHDAVIGPRCELAPHSVVGGYAVLGSDVKLGIGAVVKPKIRIGHGSRIGAGAVVTHHVPPGEVWAGVPARPLRRT